MKEIKRFATIFAALLLCAANILAVDLKNEDGVRYEVKIHDGPTTLNTSIDGNSTVANICSSCEIEVVGVGRIKVQNPDRLVIKDGKLLKQ